MSGVLGQSLRPKGLLGYLAKDGGLVGAPRGHGDQVGAVLLRRCPRLRARVEGRPSKGLLLSAERSLEEDIRLRLSRGLGSREGGLGEDVSLLLHPSRHRLPPYSPNVLLSSPKGGSGEGVHLLAWVSLGGQGWLGYGLHRGVVVGIGGLRGLLGVERGLWGNSM